MTTEISVKLEAIIERRNPTSNYHRRCMAILDNALPQELLDELDKRLVVVEAAAEHEKPIVNGHAALIMLSSRILVMVSCDEWDKDAWHQAILTQNLQAIQEHLNRISEDSRHLMLGQSVAAFLWQNVYFDAIYGAKQSTTDTTITEHNVPYYLEILFAHIENSLQALFQYLSDPEGQLPQNYVGILIPIVEDAIEAIIREATQGDWQSE